MYYAVVKWYNGRTNRQAGFMKYFENSKDAQEYAYRFARRDSIENGYEGNVIVFNSFRSPYCDYALYSVAGNDTGEETMVYSVVLKFRGVENSWDDYDDFIDEDRDKTHWVPKYY